MVSASQGAPRLRLMSTSRATPRLVGRERELARLREALARVESRGGAAFVLGEPGIGKSRLLDELRTAAHLPADRFLVGACTPARGLAMPYGAVTGAFRPLLRERGRAWFGEILGSDLTDLAPILPTLGRRSARRPDGDLPARVIEAVHAVLGALAVEGRVVLAIEDLHWAPDSTLGLLAALLADPIERLLVVATAREEALPPAIAALVGEDHRSEGRVVLRPEPLTVDEVADQVAALTGIPPSPADARAIHARSGGNPFLVEEVVAGADAARGFAADVALRMVGLGTRATLVARLVAVHGEPLRATVLRDAVGGDDDGSLAEATAACVAAGLLLSDARAGAYRYRHALLSDAVEETIPPIERPAIHGMLATAIRARGTDDPAGATSAARHYLAAGRPADALPLLVRAAEGAAAAGAFQEALDALAAAREAHRATRDRRSPAGPGATSISEARIVGLAARTLAVLGRVADADRRFVEAIGLADDEEERLELLASRAQWLWTAGLEREAAPIRSDLARYGSRRGAHVRSLDLLHTIVRAMVGESMFEAGEPLALLALRRARRAGRTDVEAGALAALGLLHGFTRRTDEGIAELASAAELAAARGHHEQFVLASGNHVALLADAERRDDVGKAVERWASVARRLSLPTLVDHLQTSLVEEAVWTGRWPEAEARLAELERRPGLADAERLRVSISRAELAMRRGQLQTAGASITAAAGPGGAASQAHAIGLLMLWRARFALAQGDLEDARSTLHELVSLLTDHVEDGVWYEAAALAVQLERRRWQAGAVDARRRMAELVRLERRRRAAGLRLNPGAVAASAIEMRADVATVRGRPSGALRIDVARRWEALRRPAEAAEAWIRAAESLVAEGDGEGARRAAARAGTLADELGLRPVAAAASRISLATDRRRRGAVSLEGGGTLTTRETEVLRLIAGGRTNRQIAAALAIGEKTAATHVSNVLAKLGVARRTEAAIAAFELGLTGEPARPPETPARRSDGRAFS